MKIAAADHGGDEVGDRPGRDVEQALAERRRQRRPGMTSPAWFASVPYHGMRPRSSRTSVVPITATHAATAGPPRFIAAMIGAMATADGYRAGRARARQTRSAKARPEAEAGRSSGCRRAIRPPRNANSTAASWRKHKGRDQRVPRAPKVTTLATYTFRDLDIIAPRWIRPETVTPFASAPV